MGVDNIDILELQTGERRLEALNDVFPRETVVVDENLTIGRAVVDLW